LGRSEKPTDAILYQVPATPSVWMRCSSRSTPFAPWPEALPTTLEIAERCSTEIELGRMLLPRYPTPPGEDEDAHLRRRAEEGTRGHRGSPGLGGPIGLHLA
jgi:DNA polymerase III alpha subunit